jgi:cell wall-associated NlpC family hydrolase
MKKTVISTVTLLAVATGLSIGITSILSNVSENAEVTADNFNEACISPNTVVMEYASAIDVELEEVITEPKEQAVLEEVQEEPECEFPEWQNSVVANVEGSLRVREEASTDAEIVGKLYPNAVATILEVGDEWTKIESGSVTGYVANEFLIFGDEAGRYITENYEYCATVEVPVLNVRMEDTTDSECIGTVTGGQELEVVSEADEWIEIQYDDDTVAYVSSEFVDVGWNYPEAMTIEEEQEMIAAALAEQASASQTSYSSETSAVLPAVNTSAEGLALGQQIASYACQFVGNPYVYGGTSLTNGADCSGFTMAVYAQFGYSLPHQSGAQAGCGTAVALSDVQPGDIICYSGHVGIYIGGGQIVHACTEETGIIISNMYYTSPIGARRIVQ